jgi:hypothetical protein
MDVDVDVDVDESKVVVTAVDGGHANVTAPGRATYGELPLPRMPRGLCLA